MRETSARLARYLSAMRWLLVPLLFPLLVVAACDSKEEARSPKFVVAAAASLADVMTEALETWNASHEVRGTMNLAGSSSLAQQVIRGAKFHVFISADVAWIDELEKHALVEPDSRRRLALNELVLIQRKGAAPSAVELVQDAPVPPLIEIGQGATGDLEHVPIGRYAAEALRWVGWYEATHERLVGTQDVRAALHLVESDSVDWGIVYRTDALSSEKVKVLGTFPRESHAPIEYPAVLISGASEGAAAFLEWLAGDEGRALFERHGFLAPGS